MSIGASLQSLFQGKREKVLGVSERLMLRYGAKGDEASLAALFDLHNHKLFYFLKMLSDRAVAEDICQRTWIKVIEIERYLAPFLEIKLTCKMIKKIKIGVFFSCTLSVLCY